MAGIEGTDMIMSVPDDSVVQGSKSATGDRGDRPELYNIKRKQYNSGPHGHVQPIINTIQPNKVIIVHAFEFAMAGLFDELFFLFRIVWGGGGGYVIKSKHNITIPCPILCL
jgi:hypothetical protein